MSEPDAIAIVGLGCRVSGAAGSAAFWDLLRDGASARPGAIDGALGFDAAFFGVSAREAVAMDPQQRLALELAWEGLEDAGHDPGRWRDGEVAVFVAAAGDDYADVLRAAGDAPAARPGGAANRISEFFGLRGVSLAVGGGASSSLVAVHLACESLRNGESRLALAGGVGSLGALLVLRRFADAVADGDRTHAVIRGSAVRSGAGTTSPILARERVMRAALDRAGLQPGDVGYVELCDEASASEAAALEQVYGADRAPLAVGSIGTSVGDLGGAAGIVALVKTALCLDRRELVASSGAADPDPPGLRMVRDHEPWPPGEGLAAGVSSFDDAAASCHVLLAAAPQPALAAEGEPAAASRPAPAVAAENEGEPAAASRPAPAVAAEDEGEPAAASRPAPAVAAEDEGEPAAASRLAPAVAAEDEGEPAAAVVAADDGGRPCVPWVVSALDELALRAQARRLREHVAARPELAPVDVGWSLATTRARLARRAVVVGSDRATLLARLDAVAAGGSSPGAALGSAGAPGKVAFVFPGQGSQWLGMALELWDASEVFAERMDACAQALGEFVDWDLRDVLAGAPGAPRLDRTDVVQPVSFAVFVSLAALWRSLGVEPSFVVGASQGEIAAAHVGGALTLRDAARVVALRARLLARVPGAMTSLALTAAEAQERIAGTGLVVGGYNGPRTTVVSGETAAVEQLMASCEAAGERAWRVAIEYPAHSAAIESIREELLEDLAPVAPVAGTIPIISTATAGLVDGATMGAEHWYRNEREPVRLEQATRALLDAGVTTFIEVSPHPVLTWAVRETVDDASAAPGRIGVVGSLRRDEGGMERFLTSVGEAHAGGVQLDWHAVFARRSARRPADLRVSAPALRRG